ncbi:hypothetical protein SLS56_009462 [Neofusicoccum ribis]|uniref:Uncharacterized protein n=1 Tax=Neofusicoccum ribis TaxID=45134 RepID=A0ABR3SHN5_9PEZI
MATAVLDQASGKRRYRKGFLPSLNRHRTLAVFSAKYSRSRHSPALNGRVCGRTPDGDAANLANES